MRILNLFKKIMMDERAALLDWGLDWLGANERGDPPSAADNQWSNAKELQDATSGAILGKIGNPTKYSYNPALDTKSGPVEDATQAAILKGLNGQDQSQQDIFGIYDKYAKARRASAEETNQNNLQEQMDAYNRLGLVSSTPGLDANDDLRRQQGIDMDLINADIARQGVGAEYSARGLDSDIANKYISQGQILGNNQRGYQRDAINSSENDIQRMSAEDLAYLTKAIEYLGKGSASPAQLQSSAMGQYNEPNTYDWLSGGVKDINNTLSGSDSSGMDIGSILKLVAMGG